MKKSPCFALEGHTHETTMKLNIADGENLQLCFDSTTKLARTGFAQGTESGVLNRRSMLEILLCCTLVFIL